MRNKHRALYNTGLSLQGRISVFGCSVRGVRMLSVNYYGVTYVNTKTRVLSDG